MRVRHAMTPGVETIGAQETLEVAARRMRDRGVGALVVCEGDEDDVIGMITDRDIVVRALAFGLDPVQTAVRSAMTAHVIECRDEDDLEAAALRMERGAVRRVVVLDAEGRLAGMLSLDDVALRSAALAGEILEHVRAPEHLPAGGRDPADWEETATMPP